MNELGNLAGKQEFFISFCLFTFWYLPIIAYFYYQYLHFLRITV